MGIDDERKHENEEFLARRLKLVPGEAREAAPHQAPTLALVVNADRKLLEAIMANDARQVSTWLARGANPNARDADAGRTPLFEAVLPWKDPAIAELLLSRGANVRLRDKDGQTPLHAAAAFGGEAHLRFVLDRGAELDARDAAGSTPLHCAARLGRIEAVTQLVSRGADVGIRDHQGRTPLDRVRANRLLDPRDNRREPRARLLGGFMTAEVVAARPEALILRVKTVHSRFTEADRRATERGILTVPCGIFHEAPEPGQLVRCEKGLTPALDEAWNQAHRRDLDIERER